MSPKTVALEEMTEDQRNARTNVAVPMPMFLRMQFEKEAKAEEKQLGPYVRDRLAELLGITLPEITVQRKRKYASEEERKAAQKAAALKRKEEVKAALAEYRARRAEAANGTTAANDSATAETVEAESEAVATA